MRRLLLATVAAATLVAGPVIAQAPNPAPPTATTGGASAATRTAVTVTGEVDPNGAATTYRVEYGTSTAYGLKSVDRSAGSGTMRVSISVRLTGLTPATTYHYRVVATNAAGIARGADRTLRTGPAPPRAVTGAVAELTARGALLTGTVNPRGTKTRYRFEYGKATRLNRRTGEQGAGGGTLAVPAAARLALAPRTRYSYRLVARGSAGVQRGARRSFTTPPATAIQVTLKSNRVIYGAPLLVTGRILGRPVSGVRLALELRPFPFSGPFVQIGVTRGVAADGSFRFKVTPLLLSAKVRVVTRTGSQLSSVARTVRTRVRPRLRVKRRPGRRVSFSGSILPAVPGARASLQRKGTAGFVIVRRRTVRPLGNNRSRYRITIRMRRRTTVYRVVVRPPPSSGHVRGTSRTRRIRAIRRG